MRRIIHNSMRTPDGTVLTSRYRHEYVTHVDENGKTYMVDGGIDYLRRSCNGDEHDLSIYDDASHFEQKYLLKWGTRGKSGQEELLYKPIALMSTEHIENVLNECVPMPVLKNCMEEELRIRNDEAVS